MLGGESLIINTFTANDGPAELTLAPGVPGDAFHYHLDNNTLFLQRGAFMAYTDGVELTGKWQGAKGFFSGEGLVLLKASGVGDLFFNSYGAILEVDVTDEYIVDTGHLLAYEPTISIHVGLSGGIFSSFFGGEGFVSRIKGQGKIYLQSRSMDGLAAWTNSHI